MKKILNQGLVLVVLFFLTWSVLAQVDWMTLFKVQHVTDTTEEKLGELFWESFRLSEKENSDPFVAKTVDSIVSKICSGNGIDEETLKVHICNNDEINAFALPDGHLLIYSGLIVASDNQAELSGVICHEIAHIQLNHVIKTLVAEVGLSVLISMATGNGGAELIQESVRVLSSSAFSRSFEKEADCKAIEYLINARIDPEPFANFLFKLSEEEPEAITYLSWISTHPESKERAEYIIEYSKNWTVKPVPVISEESWRRLKNILTDER